ncbi:MAG: serine/threonine-protein kinase, partial [Polyangiales bacterium]
MSANGSDDTTLDFPTYAQMTQTNTWVTGPTRHVVPTVNAPSVSPTARYAETALLGEGGMGKVVLAHDARIGREIALKELRADRDLGPAERERFLREARVQGQLEHPSIVPVYDIDRRTDGTVFFTMRRVLGRTLHTVIEDLATGEPAAVARYTQRELLTAFATICLTIDYAHMRGVIHRDLKPANIMLGDFGEVYVLDWGLARLVDEIEPEAAVASRLSTPGMLMGTPQYMAPEQMEDSTVGPSAD